MTTEKVISSIIKEDLYDQAAMVGFAFNDGILTKEETTEMLGGVSAMKRAVAELNYPGINETMDRINTRFPPDIEY